MDRGLVDTTGIEDGTTTSEVPDENETERSPKRLVIIKFISNL